MKIKGVKTFQDDTFNIDFRNEKRISRYGVYEHLVTIGNMRFVARILEDLGYEKNAMILDGDDHALKIRDSLVT